MLESQYQIDSIIGGSSAINSTEEFEALLKKFPNHCFLVKSFADFLTYRESSAQAAQYYRKAAELFAREGLILYAVTSKVMEWHVARSSRRECRDLYRALREVRPETPLDHFLCPMTYSELLAVVTNLEPLHLLPGAMIKNPGDAEEFLYFIVSGTVTVINLLTTGSGEEFRREFSANSAGMNYFGDVYPFYEQKQFPSVIEAVNSSELLKISKSQLFDLCEKYPKIEILLMRLAKAHRLTEDEVLHNRRQSVRYQLQAQVDMNISKSESYKSQLLLKCLIENISLGGACIILGERYLTGHPVAFIGKSVKVVINVPKVKGGLNLFGSIVWCREILRGGRNIVIAGIQFGNMTHSDLAFLKEHCYVGEEAQDMISYLWESLPKG